MRNIDIQRKIANAYLPKWKIAETIGISDATFSRWLRYELTPERKAMIQSAIEKLSNGRSA